MKNGRFQAKDIGDAFFLGCVDFLSMQRQYPWHEGRLPGYSNFPHWVMWTDLERVMPAFPWQVIIAKAAQLKKRGLLDGCVCGCRGDFELTEDGRDFLRQQFGPIYADGPTPPPSPKVVKARVEQKARAVRRLGFGPPLIPPERVRAVLLETSDPARLDLVLVKKENN